jgi:hypothetical protein
MMARKSPRHRERNRSVAKEQTINCIVLCIIEVNRKHYNSDVRHNVQTRDRRCLGQRAASGHYVAAVKQAAPDKWKLYDDVRVSEISDEIALRLDRNQRDGYLYFLLHESLVRINEAID